MIVVAALEAPTVVAGLYDVAVMGQAIEQCCGHFGVAEDARPFPESEVGSSARDATRGYPMLKERGIELIAADQPDAFLDDTPTATLIRQVLGGVTQFEKAMLVSKLRGARIVSVPPASRWKAAKATPSCAQRRWRWRVSCTASSCPFARSPPSCSRSATPPHGKPFSSSAIASMVSS